MKIDKRRHTQFGFSRLGMGLCFVLGLALSAPVFGQTTEKADDANTAAEKPTALTHPNNPMIWDVDTMMEQAVQQISKRYNLNPKQEEYTRLLLKRRVNEFLDQHEVEVRELLQESIDMRKDPSKAGTVALQVWAQRALPLYEEAAQAIIDGNEEWGVILTDDQKKIHNADMDLMKKSFSAATNTITAWSEGKGPALTPIASARKPSTNADDKNDGKGVTNKPVSVVRPNIEENWKSYVILFAEAYGLDQAATNSANEKIYKEQYDKAQQYRESKADEFARIQHRLDTLSRTDYREREKLQDRKQDLERRIYDLFIEMDERLQRLPTAAQSANVDAKKKKDLENLYAALSGKRSREARKAREARERITRRKLKEKEQEAPTTQPETNSPGPDETTKPAVTKETEPKAGESKPEEAAEETAKPKEKKKSDGAAA